MAENTKPAAAKPAFTKKRHRKTCYFTDNKIDYIDFRDVEMLKRFISDRGKILPRRVTGTCAKHQRELAKIIKRSRMMAVIPFTK